ncbi:hypothetical protein A9Q84_00445 [Halobacteriovorax marinus]|uniref:ASCH domain-containing protein n=1 Tax=Halobacteriovorax marinus TaxID=97084 RepID=A0A1Y5FBE6_9BACT|nr:hypothetical protein A9Q84_00445 [Halobacteriovorax marinus]
MSIVITDSIRKFWLDFIKANPKLEYLKASSIDAWSFGNTSEMADDLVSLVLAGKKTATCSLLRAYQGYEDEIPKVGVYSLICDGENNPKCIVFYTDTFLCKYNEITEKHAYEEGEGNRTLEHWRKVHTEFFSEYGGFHEEDILLCERFKVVYK